MKRRSQKAFEHNLKAEMHAGKPQDQALAIAYSVKRKAKKASGGTVESGSHDMNMAEGGKLQALKRPSTIPFYEKAEMHVTGEGQEFTPGEGEISTRMRRINRDTGEYEMHGPKKGKLKGMAEGGSISASTEKRPMPNDLHDDSEMTRENSARHAPMRGDDAKTQDDTSYQAKKGLKTTRIKHPKMVASDVMQVRLRDEEDDLMYSAHPTSPDEQPSRELDEIGPNRQGRQVPDMEDEHSIHRKPYAEGGEISRKARINKRRDALSHKSNQELANFKGNEKEVLDHKLELQRRHNENIRNSAPDIEEYAKGGMIDEMRHASRHDHELSGDEYNMPMRDDTPSEDEGDSLARSRNEMGANRQGDEVPDMEEPHSEHDEMYHDNMHDDSTEASDTMGRSASGGMKQPEEEAETMHEASVAAAIMAKRKKMAEGGEILSGKHQDIHSHGSMESDESDQADLSRNADEDANEEDQASFDALRKENYSESEGLEHMDSPEDSNEHSPEHEEEDVNDRSVVSAIRSKMKKKSAMTR